jgi:single-strand selective monofunctional uracil DNA glycosylase
MASGGEYMGGDAAAELTAAALRLQAACDELVQRLICDSGPVETVYHPLQYAWEPHAEYLRRWGGKGAQTILLGMNPGPWGMGQTGVPFGDVHQVRNLLEIQDLAVSQPDPMLEKRPVIGLESPRSEVSGSRLWGFLGELYGGAEQLFGELFVVNHCPLLMFDAVGRNLTPDKLSGAVAQDLMRICDGHLFEVVQILRAERVVGVGAYAEKRARIAFDTPQSVVGLSAPYVSPHIERIPHPSPASPLANRNGGADWRAAVAAVLLPSE